MPHRPRSEPGGEGDVGREPGHSRFDPSHGTITSTGESLRQARILIVDDEAANLSVLERLLRRAGYLHIASTCLPREVPSLFASFRPDLVCLDLRMPDLDGLGVLQAIAPLLAEAGYLPVLILTGDTSQRNKRRAMILGASDFLTKPFDADEILLRIRNLLEPRFMHLRLREQNLRLEDRVTERTRELDESRIEVLERLAHAAEFRDDATGQHTRRVGRISGLLASAAGIASTEADLIGRAAPLHDVGKIGIPDEILLKPGVLSEAEFEVMKQHTTIGAEILSGGRSALMQTAEVIALSHHERWDGTGYPAGLTAEAIPLGARIVAIADFFDALTHPRSYRPAWALADVLAELRAGIGGRFDPVLAEAFLQLPHAALM